MVAVPLLVALAVRGRVGFLADPDIRLWATLFVSVCIQALPFLVLVVVISGLIAAFISPDLVQRLVPRRTALAVPSAGLAGIALPGCECGSVPIAGRLISAGTPPAAALTFLLAAPAINPVVLVSTAVAFPNDGRLVLARFLASFAAAVAVGTWWARRTGQSLRDTERQHQVSSGRIASFVDVASRDFVHAGGYLVVGAAAAATLQLVVPRSILDSVAGSEVSSIIVLALLAVLLSICSEADAFVAAGLPQFSLTSRLVFLVVGPVIDVKLVAMHAGVFGRAFALRFAPVTFGVAVASAVIMGQVLL
ncbi:MAG: permease [Acidimicrobiia bacterium]|nr:permease [Acidimicrobiia bacterium]